MTAASAALSYIRGAYLLGLRFGCSASGFLTSKGRPPGGQISFLCDQVRHHNMHVGLKCEWKNSAGPNGIVGRPDILHTVQENTELYEKYIQAYS